MKKPEKKEIIDSLERGYNQACDDWEKFLPSGEEIEKIVNDNCRKIVEKDKLMLIYGNIAKAITKRLGVER